ncbi:MAG: hypothetical protein ACYCT9_11485 [Leptospirillum sp.]
MNIQYTSDLHIDHTGRKVFSSQCILGDVLVIAGDVGRTDQSCGRLSTIQD